MSALGLKSWFDSEKVHGRARLGTQVGLEIGLKGSYVSPRRAGKIDFDATLDSFQYARDSPRLGKSACLLCGESEASSPPDLKPSSSTLLLP
ncbi:hypothetical protein E2C01_053808 [Portunus trituberculatus]|uniref:Uncharacterized protein n=1 Tax=Portunus trituberculatus TaxID=210409 RepID=A0A5B7GQ69_PORTR|nr:hypothetical protein [Portunus trituberculatus]